jgi:hypothetical protein
LANLKRGTEQLESGIRTGVKSFTGDARQAGQEGLKRNEGIQNRYADEIGMDKVGAAYDKDGLFGGAKEVIRQAPLAIAQQLPNLGATATSMYAGAKLGGLGGSFIAPGPGTAIGTIGGGLAGAFLPGFLASQGANVQRQVQENPDAPVNMGAATGAAAASGALDAAGNMIPFLGVAKRVLGPKLGVALAKNPAAAERLAKEGLAMSMAKGTGVGILAETPTEVVQQMLERAQAGLSLTDADAIKEYKDTAYQAALSGPLGAAGRFADKSAARSEVAEQEIRAKQEQAQQIKAQQEQTVAAQRAQQEQEAAAQQAKLQDPAYAAQVAQEYQDAEAQFAQLKAATKVGKDASMADKLQAKAAQEQVKAFENDVLKPKAEAYLQVKPLLDAQQAQAPAAASAAPQGNTDLFGEPLQDSAAQAPARIPTPEDITAQHSQYQRQIAGLESALEQQRHNVAVAAQTGETEIAVQEAQKFRKIEAALAQARKEAAELPPAPKAGPTDDALNKQYATAQTALRKAGEIGDVDAIEKLSKKIDALRQQNPGLFTKDSVQATAAADQQTADEMATGRETAVQQRQRVEQEVAGVRGLADKEPGYAGEARKERQTQLEIEGMERAALPYGTTEQRRLFPGQYTATKVESEQTKQAQLQALALQLQAARREYKADPNNTQARKQVDALLEQMRAIKSKPGLDVDKPAPKGKLTAPVAADLAGTRSPTQDIAIERAADISPESVQQQFAQLQQSGKVSPFLQTVRSRLPELTAADELPDVAELLHRTRIGQDITDVHARVQKHLASVAQSKRSDEVPQGDMFPDTELQGVIFDTPEAFQQFLASDALNESRKAVGLALQTSARAHRTIASLEAKAAELRESIGTLQTMLTATKRVGAQAIQMATDKYVAAVAKQQSLMDAVQAKLEPARKAVAAAQKALKAAQDQRARVVDTIAKNTAKFGGDEKVQAAADAAATAHRRYKDALAHGGHTQTQLDTLAAAADKATKQHAALLERQNNPLDRSVLAYLGRDMELQLRLRDATGAMETAQSSLVAAQDALNTAVAENDSAEAQAARKQAKRESSTAQGVLTRAKATAARNTERVTAELQARAAESRQLAAEIEALLRPLEQARDARVAVQVEEALPRDTPIQRTAADAAQRKAEQERLERLQAIPGTAVSFEQARKTTEYIAELQDRAKELEERSKDETASKSMRNKDKYEAANIRKEIAIAFGTLSNETEMSTAAKQALAEHLAELDIKIGEKKAAILEPGKAKKTILQRRKDLTDLRSKKRELVRLQEQAQQRSKKTEILTPAQRAEEAQDDANRLTLERGIDASTGKSSGALPLRKAGPLVKPVRGGKITQGGRAPKMRANEQALAELSKIETLLEKAQFKLEEAQENNDAEAIEKYTGFVARLEKARPVAEQALEKSSRTARAVNGGEGPKAAPSQANRAFRTSTDMTPELAAAVADGRILDAADMLIKAGYPLAASVRPLVLRTKISVNPDIRDNAGNEVAGMYFPETNEIVMRPDAYMEDVMHELYHAATDSVLLADPATLTPEQAAARKGLEGMQRQVAASKAFANEEIPNVREFVAEARTNPEFQAKLDKYGLWDRLKNFVRRMFGMPQKPPTPTAKQVADLVDKIMMPSRRIQGAGTPSVQRTTGSAKDVVDRIVAKDKPWWGKIKDNLSGLAFETQLVDRFAGFERLSRVMEPLKGSQMMYYLRMYDQRQHFLSVAAANGVPQRVEKTRADGKKEYMIESVKGANLKGIADTLAKASIEDKNYVTRLFTGYMAAIRAKSKGIETLNFGGDITQADLDAIAQEVQNTPGLKDVFEDARSQYNEYNRNLIKLLEQSGAISKDVGAKLVKEDDYIPYYRDRNGVAELLIGSESPIRIGNMKEQPHLQELVGGDRPILDFTTSAVQNTSMILDMALNNIATKNAAFELQDMGMATIGNGHDVKGNTIVKFYDNGAEKFARVDTPDSIPADLLVKGMAGIPTQLSGVVRLLAMPAQLLRKAVTISPVYAARQVFRDSLGAALGSGANITPVWSAVKEINAKNKEILNNRGITGGQVFTGTSEDMSMVLRDVTAGKSGWLNALGKLEAMSMGADALTRRAQYGSYIKQGMSEMEATLQTLESMNFSKRGASPSIHMANAMIPFLNAQIQSLNVLYKAFTGNMPNDERLNIKGKLIARGTLLAAASLAYAAAMEDDEAYKNALPEQKYGNWFVRVPGVEEAIRVPVPFELGYIFKSVPEALYRSMTDKHGSDEAVNAFSTILRNTIPGGSSFLLPQAIKPLIEVGTGKSLFTGRDILSRSEQGMEKPFQFRENTTQIAREVGQLTGQSPIMMEQLLNGYTGGVGMFVLAAVDSLMPASDSPEKAARRLSSRPMIGGVFQPNDAGGIINDTYEKMGEFTAFKKTVDGLLEKGEKAQAMQLLQERSKEYAGATVAGAFTQKMGQLSKAETAIRASNRSPEEKRRMLDNIRQYKIQTAAAFREAYGKIKGE